MSYRNVTSNASSSSWGLNNATLSSICDHSTLHAEIKNVSNMTYQAPIFRNTITIEHFHFGVPRFGHGKNISADLIQGSPTQQRNYLVGLFASSIALFAMFALWVIILLVLKMLGPSRVGLFSGRRIPHPEPPQQPCDSSKIPNEQMDPKQMSSPQDQGILTKDDENDHHLDDIDGKNVVTFPLKDREDHSATLVNEIGLSDPFYDPTGTMVQSHECLYDCDHDRMEISQAEQQQNPERFECMNNERSDQQEELMSINLEVVKSATTVGGSMRTNLVEEAYPTALDDYQEEENYSGRYLPHKEQETLKAEQDQENYHLALTEWKTRVDRYENRLCCMRVGVVFAGTCIIISTILMIVEGIGSIEKALASATSGVFTVADICDYAIALIDTFVVSQTKAQKSTLDFLTELNGTLTDL